jgi:N-acetylglucosamine kinase-like BadF-type ATPase
MPRPYTRTFFLGVDGGGTKTRFVLVDSDGKLAASHEGPTSYHLQIGIESVRVVLADGLAALFGQAKTDGSAIAHAFFGLPGHGEDSTTQALLDGLPQPLLGHCRYRCGNDMVCAFAGSLGGEDGINIVAGTGSIGYGERSGASARAGGWGEMFGDEGSAYWIALKGLNTFSRMSDGRLPMGPLHSAFKASLDLTADLDICAAVMNAPARERIAAMARLVTRVAQDGDATAVRIFDDAACELAGIAEAVRQALGYEADETVPLSYSGGVFNVGALILEPLKRHLAQTSVRYRLQAPILPPHLGAVICAARLAGKPLSAVAIGRLASAVQ